MCKFTIRVRDVGVEDVFPHGIQSRSTTEGMRHATDEEVADGLALTVAAGGLVTLSGLAEASGIGGHGVVREEEANVSDPIVIKEKRGAQVLSAHITVAPRGHTPWHYHPGPHFVSVRTGTVEIYETDCTSRAYPAGSGFFDPGPTDHPHIHTLYNPSDTEPAEVLITDIRTDDLRPTVLADPQLDPCFS